MSLMLTKALAILLALAGLAIGVITWQLSSERTSHEKDRTAFQERVGASEKAKVTSEENYAGQIAAAVKQKGQDDEQISAMAAELAKRSTELWNQAGRARTLGLDNGRLRQQLSDYAGSGANDSAVACKLRAAALADLLGEGDAIIGTLSDRLAASERLAGEAAESQARTASDLKTCVTAWPRNQ